MREDIDSRQARTGRPHRGIERTWARDGLHGLIPLITCLGVAAVVLAIELL